MYEELLVSVSDLLNARSGFRTMAATDPSFRVVEHRDSEGRLDDVLCGVPALVVVGPGFRGQAWFQKGRLHSPGRDLGREPSVRLTAVHDAMFWLEGGEGERALAFGPMGAGQFNLRVARGGKHAVRQSVWCRCAGELFPGRASFDPTGGLAPNLVFRESLCNDLQAGWRETRFLMRGLITDPLDDAATAARPADEVVFGMPGASIVERWSRADVRLPTLGDLRVVQAALRLPVAFGGQGDRIVGGPFNRKGPVTAMASPPPNVATTKYDFARFAKHKTQLGRAPILSKPTPEPRDPLHEGRYGSGDLLCTPPLPPPKSRGGRKRRSLENPAEVDEPEGGWKGGKGREKDGPPCEGTRESPGTVS